MALLVGYAEGEEIPQQGIQAGAVGPQPPVMAGTGLVHAYLEDFAEKTLCGKTIVDATSRSFPTTQSGEEVCPECMHRSEGLET